MSRLDAERAIVEYLVATGFISEAADEVAKRVLDGIPLDMEQREIFDREIADRWFNINCDKCGVGLSIEAIAEAINSWGALCPNCRPPESDRCLILGTK